MHIINSVWCSRPLSVFASMLRNSLETRKKVSSRPGLEASSETSSIMQAHNAFKTPEIPAVTVLILNNSRMPIAMFLASYMPIQCIRWPTKSF